MARKHVDGQLGLFKPESDWVMPRELPDLRGRRAVAIDTEEKDDGLGAGRGPGWALGPAGYICGVSWATEGSIGYAPIAHPETDCFPKENVWRWLTDLHKSGTRIVFHNGPYDIGWLGTEGVPAPVLFEDTSCAAVMLDEQQRSYSLDNCAAREGIPGKDKTLLADAVEAYGGNRKNPAADLWRLPAKYVGPYAEADGVATLGLWGRYEPALRAQDVWDAYRTEIDLIPLVVEMRRRGIRVNLDRAEQVAKEFRAKSRAYLDEIGAITGMRRQVTIDDIRSNSWMVNVFAIEKINFPRTAKSGQGSFSQDWMENHEHPLPRAVVKALRYEDAATKFCENFLMSYASRGRLHAEVHQFKTDDGGTRSQRFSYSNPPLQQMPGTEKPTTKEMGIAIRGCFLPEKGELWCSNDYSQQEPRLTVHFAALCRAKGAQTAVDRYIDNPRTDYHSMVAEMTGKVRSVAKILNLGMTYGKGKHSLAAELGLPLDEAEVILEEYHHRLPFIKDLEDIAKRKSAQRGFIRLIDGARMHYNEWEGGWMEYEDRKNAIARGKLLTPCSLEEARKRQQDPDHPWSKTRLRRADTRKALNNLIQGSAARQTKRAMLEMWRQGIVPLIQMHDEVGASVASEKESQVIAQIMVETTPLLVPVIVDTELGDTWGTAKSSWADAVEKYGAPTSGRVLMAA